MCDCEYIYISIFIVRYHSDQGCYITVKACALTDNDKERYYDYCSNFFKTKNANLL